MTPMMAAITSAMTSGRSAWAGSTTIVSTNAPVLRWASSVQSGGTFSYTVLVADAVGTEVWSSGEVWQGNWPAHAPKFPGLCVYEGPSLVAGATYSFSVTEQQVADETGKNVTTSWTAGGGKFQVHSDVPSAQAELVAQIHSANMTRLWNTSSTSIWSRVEPSGFLPTSVSNSFGGITSEFVRDSAGMIIGILELGPAHWPTARKAMRFMLHGLQCTQNDKVEAGCSIGKGMVRNPPEVLKGDCPEAARQAGTCAYNTKIVDVDANEETDGAFYVIAAWGRVVAVTGDTSLEDDFFSTLKTYMDFYFPAGAPPVSSTGTAYWNESLGLLWTPNLEHSRLMKMWSVYDALTNSFAVEAMRYMIGAASRQGELEAVPRWTAYRNKILHGLETSLAYSGVETGGEAMPPIYAELLGHVNGYGEDSQRQNWTLGDRAPLLFGMSWVQLAPINNLLSHLSNAGGGAGGAPLTPLSELGISPERLDNTLKTYANSGSFLWIGEDIETSALVHTTSVNSSHLRAPPFRTGPMPPPPPPFPPSSCAKPLRGEDALLVASGPDAWNGVLPDYGACCAKCEAAGLAICGTWFYREDTKRCILKVDGSPDSVTTPSDAFFGGVASNAPPHHFPSDGWCDTVSWPFGGSCKPGCPCPARVVIGKGLGWEIGWAAHRARWTRLIAIHRWLAAAHHVEKEALFAELLDYDCLKAMDQGKAVSPSNGRCWGDAGNGVQIGWWIWGEAFMRRKLGLL